MKLIPRARRVCLLAAGTLAASIALAQTFPTRPITFVVPVAPGAANDALARLVATELKEALGPTIVENRPGGNAMIGAEFVKRSAPDGHTLLVAPNQFVIHAAMNPTHPVDFLRDFEPVVLAINLPFFLVVNQESMPVRSLQEFVEFARKEQGKLAYGSAGNGSPHHFATEMLKLQTGIDAVHVPYKGMALGIPDLLTGRIQFIITGYPAVAAQMKAGKLRMLATAGSTRSLQHPDLPTFAEAGVGGVVLDTWMGFLVPTGTPRPTIERLNTEINRVLKLQSVREKMNAQGMDVLGGTREAFAARIRDDHMALSRVVKATGIRAE
ncbi:MAG: Bug family tripartite tricarboxylate transporter substrate binding protein [Burkholderiales bacterium]